jgi:hypothetical protein
MGEYLSHKFFKVVAHQSCTHLVIILNNTQPCTIATRYLFNMRTKPDSGVILITAFDFYTHSTTDVEVSLYSRVGSFKDYKGSTDGWDVIAQGKVTGRGIGRYTSIPEEMFTPVDIPGGGETRAFYLTLNTIDLVYKTGEGTASDAAIQVREVTSFVCDAVENGLSHLCDSSSDGDS